MNVSSITLNENCKPRRNMFIKYSNSFMSMMNGGSEAVEKAQKVNPSNDKKLDKSMGIETALGKKTYSNRFKNRA